MYIRHYIFIITIMIATLIAARQPAELTTHHLQAAPTHLGLCGDERSSPRSPQCPHSGRRATRTPHSGRRTSTTSTTSPLECKFLLLIPLNIEILLRKLEKIAGYKFKTSSDLQCYNHPTGLSIAMRVEQL